MSDSPAPAAAASQQPNRNALWRRLTEPARAVSDPETRRRARLLAAVLLVLLPAAIAAILFGRLALEGETEQTLFSAGGLLVVTALFVAFRTARTAHVQFAAWLALIAITAVPVGSVVLRALTLTKGDEVAVVTTALSWTLMPVLLSNFVMPIRSTAVFVGLLSVGIGLLPVFLELLAFTDVVEPLGFVVAVSALVMVAGGIRQEDQQRIESQNVELSRSEQRFRGLFDGTSVGTCVHDSELGVIDINLAFERLFGYSLDTAMELSVADLVVEGDRELLVKAIRDRTGEVLEVRGVRRDGSHFDLEATANTHISRGEVIQLLELRDISELREAQGEARRARLVAEEAARAQGEFLVHVGRTLRPPLSQAVKVVNTLATNRRGNLREEDLTFLRRLSEAHSALDSKIKDVLLLSQLETGRLGLDLSQTMLDRLAQDLIDASQQLTRQKPLTLSLVKPQLVAPITIDAPRVRQVLKYLMAHAITVTPKGFVTLRIDVDPEHHVPTAVTVIDGSTGMSKADQEKIFEPLDQALKADAAGLGLTICRALVEMMGFGFDVESEIMQGSTFTIDLSTVEPSLRQAATEGEVAKAVPAPEPAAADEVADGETVVLCIGDDALQDICRQALEPGELTVVSGASLEAIDATLDAVEAAVAAFIPGDSEAGALGPLDALLALDERPPTVAVAYTDERLALLGLLDAMPWPPTAELLEPVVQRHLDAVAGSEKRRVLVVSEDEKAGEEAIVALKATYGCDVRLAVSPERALDLLRSAQFDLFILDIQLALTNEAMDLLTELRRDRRYVPVPLVLGVAAKNRQGAARRLQLVAESIARPADKAMGELRRLVETVMATRQRTIASADNDVTSEHEEPAATPPAGT